MRTSSDMSQAKNRVGIASVRFQRHPPQFFYLNAYPHLYALLLSLHCVGTAISAFVRRCTLVALLLSISTIPLGFL